MKADKWIINFEPVESKLIMRILLLQHQLIELVFEKDAIPSLDIIKHLVQHEFREFHEIDAQAKFPTRMEVRSLAIADIIYNKLVQGIPEDYTFEYEDDEGIIDYITNSSELEIDGSNEEL